MSASRLPPESALALRYLRETLAATLEDCERECGRIPECDRVGVERRLLELGLIVETQEFVQHLRESVTVCLN